MPPESVPWDRKDFFKERKHERFDSPGSVGRWRESSYYGSREFSRWGSANRGRPPCHGKQDGWHFFSEESGHGYGPPRLSVDRMLEDESCRPSVSRGGGKYRRSERESRGGSNQRDWRGHPWETNCGTTSNSGRSLHSVNNDNRAADDAIPYSYHPQTNFVQTLEQVHLKDQRDKIDGINDLDITLRGERDRSVSSINGKPLKWTRNGSLSTRGSGLSHLSDSRSIDAIDSCERKSESLPKNATPDHSLSGNVVACVTSAPPSEEEISKKKPRLGWGEGLAKYEKKKVEPDICLYKERCDFSSNLETTHSLDSSLAEKSPRILGCDSPATPSSVAFSSSPGMEGKSSSLTVNVDNETSNLCGSPSPVFMTLLGGLSHSLDNLEIKSISSMGTLLIELLYSDYSNSVDSSSIAMDKLLIFRSQISKELEITESEIDILESEIKSLKSENGYENSSKHFIVSSFIPEPAPLEIACDKDSLIEKMSIGNLESEEVLDMKDKDIDSTGTVTSKCFQPCSFGEAVPLLGVNLEKKVGSSGNLDSNQASTVKKISMTASSENKDYLFSNGDYSVHDPINNETGSNFTRDGSVVDRGTFRDLILAANRKYASEACKEFHKLLPVTCCESNIWDDMVSYSLADPLVEKKFSQRKRFLRFKDRVLVVKFQVLKHLWKKDFHLLPTRKSRVKSQRKTELTLRVTHGVCHKSRSSIRPCLSSDYPSLVPIGDIINHTSKLLSDSLVMLQRNILKMPALILDEKGKCMSKWISKNGLVEDPCALEKERGMINLWTSDEKQIFLDQLATYGKDFRKIASSLSHKTTADCVEFYYKNHKSDSFKKMNKKQGFKQAKSNTNTYLLTTGKKWNREMCTASLDMMLGAASMIASHGDSYIRDQSRFSRKSVVGRYVEPNIGKGNDDVKENTSCVDFVVNERETVAADVLAGICGSLSSEAMSSCVTSSVVRLPLIPNSDHDIDDDTCSDESCEEMDPSDWTDEEKSSFILAVSSYGTDFITVSKCVGTRSRDQCKVFFSKVRKCLELDSVRKPGNHATPGSDGANGSGSDSEDGCILDTDTTVCHDNTSSRLTKYVSLDVNMKHEESADTEIPILENVSVSAQKSSLLKLDCKDNEADTVLLSDSGQKSRSRFSSIKDFNSVKPAYNEIETLHEQKTSVVAANINHTVTDLVSGARILVSDSMSIGGENHQYHLNVDAITCEKGVVLGNDESRRDQKKSNSRDDSQNNLQCAAEDAGENASHLAADQSSSTLDREFSQQVPLEFDSAERSFIISFTHEDSLAVAKTCPQSAITKGNRLSSSPDLYEGATGQGHEDIENGDLVDGQQRHLLLSHESSHIHLRYPLHAPGKKVMMNVDINCMKVPEGQIQTELDQDGDNQKLAEGSCLRECSIVKPRCLATEFPLLSPKSDHEKTSSDSGIPCKHGDVRLFGKILSHLSSEQRSSCSSHENEHKSQFSKFSDKSFNLKFSEHNLDEKMSFLNFDVNKGMELENVSLRSHGFWDGNRIQTGFTSLSDPAVLLAKYPAAFGTYSMSLAKTEKQPLQAIPCSNFNGVSFFPMDGDSRSGMVQYPSFQSQDGVEVQPFTVDARYRQDMLSYMQRGKGFDAIPFPSLQQQQQQQQRRGFVGKNVVGKGGTLVGSPPCYGVSDPVAAIKMHYAKAADQFGGQSGSLTRER